MAEAAAALDRAAKVGAIHPNNAARRKSRLMRRANAALGGESLVVSSKPQRQVSKAAAAKAAKARIAAGKASKAKGEQTAAGKARAALSKSARTTESKTATAAATTEAPARKTTAKKTTAKKTTAKKTTAKKTTAKKTTAKKTTAKKTTRGGSRPRSRQRRGGDSSDRDRRFSVSRGPRPSVVRAGSQPVSGPAGGYSMAAMRSAISPRAVARERRANRLRRVPRPASSP